MGTAEFQVDSTTFPEGGQRWYLHAHEQAEEERAVHDNYDDVRDVHLEHARAVQKRKQVVAEFLGARRVGHEDEPAAPHPGHRGLVTRA